MRACGFFERKYRVDHRRKPTLCNEPHHLPKLGDRGIFRSHQFQLTPKERDDVKRHHLAAVTAPEGCRLGVVGPGTPADRAGLRAGDVIVRVAGNATADPRALADVLAARRPREKVAIDYLRDGRAADCEAVLDRRPLEVVRPEFNAAPNGVGQPLKAGMIARSAISVVPAACQPSALMIAPTARPVREGRASSRVSSSVSSAFLITPEIEPW